MATPERLTCIFHEQDPIIAPRRSSDDLPVHVKGIIRWYPDAQPQARYYVPKKYSPSGDFEPLEFINNQWFGLFRHPETSTTHLCTRASAAIPIINRLDIGYWDITDPEHPDFIPGTIETIDVDPPENTSQSHTPSTVTVYITPPENPPAPQTHYSGLTPRLTIASTSTITFPTAPSPTIIPTQPTPTQSTTTMSASATGGRSRGGGGGGGGGGGAAAAAPTSSNGGMRGIQPTIFNGTCTLADDFWAQFRQYKMVNRTHDSMTKAYDRVLTALTYIRLTMDTPTPPIQTMYAKMTKDSGQNLKWRSRMPGRTRPRSKMCTTNS